MIKLMMAVGFSLVITGCGIPSTMDSISDKMVNLNIRIDKMVKNTDAMQGSIGRMTDSLSATSNGIHSQALSIALNEMLKPENTKYITLGSANPIPMIPAAKGLAEMATQEELAGLTYIFLSEINTAQVDTVTLTKQQKDKYDLDKYIKLTALQLIAAFVPEKTIDEMVKKQIVEGGNYAESAYALLTLRAVFIKEVLLDQMVNSTKKLVTPTQYETALTYLDALKNIANYNFTNNLKIKIYGMYDTDKQGLNQTIETDITYQSVAKYYTMLSDKIAKELGAEYKLDKARIKAIKDRIKKGFDE